MGHQDLRGGIHGNLDQVPGDRKFRISNPAAVTIPMDVQLGETTQFRLNIPEKHGRDVAGKGQLLVVVGGDAKFGFSGCKPDLSGNHQGRYAK